MSVENHPIRELTKHDMECLQGRLDSVDLDIETRCCHLTFLHGEIHDPSQSPLGVGWVEIFDWSEHDVHAGVFQGRRGCLWITMSRHRTKEMHENVELRGTDQHLYLSDGIRLSEGNISFVVEMYEPHTFIDFAFSNANWNAKFEDLRR